MIEQTSATRIIRLPEVERAVGLKRQQICNLEREGRFPRRFKILGSRINGWSSAEIEEFIRQRIDGPRVTLGADRAQIRQRVARKEAK